MAVEAWDAAATLAKERGSTIEEVCFWEDCERDAKAREQFSPANRVETHTYEDRGDPVTVKLRVQSQTKSSGREYEQGDVLEITDGKWALVERVFDGNFAQP